jgi:hypothetical protein
MQSIDSAVGPEQSGLFSSLPSNYGSLLEGRIWRKVLEFSLDAEGSMEDQLQVDNPTIAIFAELKKAAKSRKEILYVLFVFCFFFQRAESPL